MNNGPLTTDVFGDVTIKSDLNKMQFLWPMAKEEVTFQVRDAVGRMFGKHRKLVLERNAGDKGMSRLLSQRKTKGPSRGALFYKLNPSDKENKKRTATKLEDIHGYLRVTSDVVLTHEQGATIRPKKGKYLAVPLRKGRPANLKKKGFDTPENFKKKHPGEKLFLGKKKSKGRDGMLLLRETGKKLKSGKSQTQAMFLLVKEVKIEPKLGIQATWNALSGYRQRVMKEALANVVKSMLTAPLKKGGRLGRSA